jgi:DNA-directed RNA polymerase sigma subunit (sigma70/sigma32)
MTTTLEQAGKRYATAQRALDEATAELHDRIRWARGDGQSLRQIAKESGLSHQRVHQLTTERAER